MNKDIIIISETDNIYVFSIFDKDFNFKSIHSSNKLEDELLQDKLIVFNNMDYRLFRELKDSKYKDNLLTHKGRLIGNIITGITYSQKISEVDHRCNIFRGLEEIFKMKEYIYLTEKGLIL